MCDLCPVPFDKPIADNGLNLHPGDVLLMRFEGLTGWLVTLLQALVAQDWSRYNHVAVVLSKNEAIEARPGGARVVSLDALLLNRIRLGRPLAVVRLPISSLVSDVRYDLDRIARQMEFRRYGWASYLWIGLVRLHIRPRWLKKLVASDRSIICSALADLVWYRAGVHAFSDGRMFGEVTPGDWSYVGTVEHIGAQITFDFDPGWTI